MQVCVCVCVCECVCVSVCMCVFTQCHVNLLDSRLIYITMLSYTGTVSEEQNDRRK